MNQDSLVLWRADDEHETTCLMISCCSGAELQMRRGDEIVLRELYPDKSTLFERARDLRALHLNASSPQPSSEDA
jgi:hypothetical protein